VTDQEPDAADSDEPDALDAQNGAPDPYEPAWVDGPSQADHYLELADAQIVGTRSLLACRDNLQDVIETRAMACMHGEAGFGKSLAVNASLRALAPDNTVRVVFRSRPTTRDIRHALFHGLHLPGRPPGHPIEFDRLLKAALSDQFRVLVCEEAQWMARECFEYWRHMWDDRSTRIAVVFVGGGNCYDVLHGEPMLASRIYLWQKFRRMGEEEVLNVIPVFHPVWSGIPKPLISYADKRAGHGNFRNWAADHHHVLQAQQRRGAQLDADLLKWVFSRLGLS